jgi:glucarate dehydratase
MLPGMRKDLIIRSIRHWLIYVPFGKPISWASGTRPGSTRLVVEVTTEGGVRGYGETICLLDFVEPVLAKVVAPIALGRSVAEAERVFRHVEAAGYYHHKRAMVMASAAVEMAMWDALGKHAGLPLHALWGGMMRERVEMCAYLFISDPAALKDEAQRFKALGYRSFKVKVGLDPADDVRIVRAVRDAIGPHANLRADPNGAWTPGTARRQLAALREFDLQYIEQPLPVDDMLGHAELRRCQTTPIAIDEGAYTLADVTNAVRLGAADVILLDPHETGGLWQCIKAAGVCEGAGIPVGLHSGGELGLSQAAYLHLAASIPNMSIAVDTEYYYQSEDILPQRLEFIDGHCAVPTGPGLGVEPDLALLERFRTDQVRGAYLDVARRDWIPTKPAY